MIPTHPERRRRRRYFRERLLRVGERARGLAARLPASPWADRLVVPEFIRDDYRYHRWLSHHYVPGVSDGRLNLFRASEIPEVVGTDFSDLYLGWRPFAAGGVEVRPVPGDHMSLLDEPHVGALAESLRDCLAR